MMDRLSQTAILFHLNTDAAATKPVAKQYHLGGIPTVVVIDPKGHEVDRIIGYDDDRSAWLKTLLASLYGIDTIQDIQTRFAAKADLKLADTLAQKYLDRGDGAQSLVWVGKARGLAPDAATESKLAFIEGQALLFTDPPKGVDALMKLATSASSAQGTEAFQALSAFYKRQARNATSPEEKKKAKAARLDVFHKVLAARPEDPDVLDEYAWYCAAEGIELDQALAAARKAIGIKKDDADAHSVLAEVALKAGQKDEALKAIERAIQLAPEDASYKEQREKITGPDEAKTRK